MFWMQKLMRKSRTFGNTNLKRAGPSGRYMVAYWLMKSEPHVYPYEQLVADGWTHWDGVRNYQARNIMGHDIKKGDLGDFKNSGSREQRKLKILKVVDPLDAGNEKNS